MEKENIDSLFEEFVNSDLDSDEPDFLTRRLYLHDVGRTKYTELISLIQSGKVGDTGTAKIMLLLQIAYDGGGSQENHHSALNPKDKAIQKLFLEILSSPFGADSHALALSSIDMLSNMPGRLDLFESSLSNGVQNDLELIYQLKLKYVAGSDEQLPRILKEILSLDLSLKLSLLNNIYWAYTTQTSRLGSIVHTDAQAISAILKETKLASTENHLSAHNDALFYSWLLLKHSSSNSELNSNSYFLSYMKSQEASAEEIAAIFSYYYQTEHTIPTTYINSTRLKNIVRLHLARNDLDTLTRNYLEMFLEN